MGFVLHKTGLDPIIGQGGSLKEGQAWPIRWGEAGAKKKRVSMAHFVTLKGGQYFFAPSMDFLQRITQVT